MDSSEDEKLLLLGFILLYDKKRKNKETLVLDPNVLFQIKSICFSLDKCLVKPHF